MGLFSVVRLQSICVVLAAGLAMRGQAPRLTREIQQPSASEIEGSISPRALHAMDYGRVPAQTSLNNLSLRFSRTRKQQQDLDQLLLDQQNATSPRFHQWLTPEEFQRRFGLARADVAKVSRWLQAQGFRNIEEGQGGSFVRFSGTAGQAESAFATELHRVTLHDESHFANVTPARLPPELAALTMAITGLDDFSPKPRHVIGTALLHSAAKNLVVGPQYTISNGTHYLSPNDFHTIYDENALLSSGTTGSGVTVAVVGQSDINLSDIAAFRAASALSATAPTVILYGSDPGFPSTADLRESELDIEWAGGTAPGATILYVNSTSVVDGSLTEAIDKNLAPIISLSYGDCEADLGAASLAYYSQLLQQASAQGMTVVAPAGDAGATDCDPNVVSASHGFAVDFPASSPQVTGVGGTSFNESAGTYFGPANGSGGGSALSYIPEVVWNDDALGGIDAAGGGRSAYFAKPAWQVGEGVPNDFARDVPDVSLNASPNHDPYLICTEGHCSNGFLDSSGAVEYVGGTSVGPPSFAGLLALVVQQTGDRLGNANSVLYPLANSTYGPLAFHDITSGSNASPCTVGTTDCSSGTIGFSANAGYDLATGLGSVDAFQLVTHWSSVTPIVVTTGTLPTFTNVAGDANNVRAGTAVYFTVSVASASAGSTATPTGNVQFTVNSMPVGSPVTLMSGAATFLLDTTNLSAGTEKVQATYLGDATFMGSRAAFVLNVSSANAPDFSFTPPVATVTVTAGQVAPGIVLTATSLNGFNETIELTASAPTGLNAEYSFSVNPIDLTSTISGNSTLILFGYTGAPQSRHQNMQFSSNKPTARSTRWKLSLAFASFCCFATLRRRKLPLLVASFVFILTVGLSGCASPANAPVAGNTPAKPGSYPVVVTASATVNGVSIVHSSTITLVVQ